MVVEERFHCTWGLMSNRCGAQCVRVKVRQTGCRANSVTVFQVVSTRHHRSLTPLQDVCPHQFLRCEYLTEQLEEHTWSRKSPFFSLSALRQILFFIASFMTYDDWNDWLVYQILSLRLPIKMLLRNLNSTAFGIFNFVAFHPRSLPSFLSTLSLDFFFHLKKTKTTYWLLIKGRPQPSDEWRHCKANYAHWAQSFAGRRRKKFADSLIDWLMILIHWLINWLMIIWPAVCRLLSWKIIVSHILPTFLIAIREKQNYFNPVTVK